MPVDRQNKRGRGYQPRSNSTLKYTVLGSISVLLGASLFAVLYDPRYEISFDWLTSVRDPEVERLRYWGAVLVNIHKQGHLRTMDRVFKRLGYDFVNAAKGDDWDVMWASEQPFVTKTSEDHSAFAGVAEKELRRDQKVNHFPGIAAMVSKSYMNHINRDSPYILPSFVLPDDLAQYDDFIQKNPNVTLVKKNFYNRGVEIIKKENVLRDSPDFFYQQFMDDHLLIDGHAFDFGVFVLITSFDPLRVYRYEGDVLFRFCIKKYHPFDPKDVNKYVVQRGCHNAYDMPTFRKTYEDFGYPFIKIFERHIEHKGHNVAKFWRKVDEAIVNITMNAESDVVEKLKKFKFSNTNCFELVRFDFLIDNKMHPYVMEVNMSPNLTPAEKRYEENVYLYEPMIYNTIQMIGGGSPFEFKSRFNDSDIIVANHKNTAANINFCVNYGCGKDCNSHKNCSICSPCLSPENRYQVREAFREQKHVGNFKRLFPTKIHYDSKEVFGRMSESNKVSINWFRAKCKDDESWC